MATKDFRLETPKASVFMVQSKGGKIKAKMEVNPGYTRRMEKSFSATQRRIDNEVMRYMEPYMQMQTGAMIMSMRASTVTGSGEVIVNTPYARKVYYSSASVGRPAGPQRGPKYFERMKADKKEAILKAAKGESGAK